MIDRKGGAFSYEGKHTTNIDKKFHTLRLFMPFSKAFDCLNRGILIKTLAFSGIRGVLLESHFKKRSQSVCLGTQSRVLPAPSGVPQGSIIAPLLFSVYIKDPVSTETTATFIIYADDTTILLSGQDITP